MASGPYGVAVLQRDSLVSLLGALFLLENDLSSLSVTKGWFTQRDTRLGILKHSVATVFHSTTFSLSIRFFQEEEPVGIAKGKHKDTEWSELKRRYLWKM